MDERKFVTLQKKLSALGYNFPLGIESVVLVEKLLLDLIHTTESFQTLRTQNNKLSNDLQTTNTQIEPLRKTNQRLIRENNQLHADIMKKDESLADREKTLLNKIKKLETENSELKFLNGQHLHRVRAKENEVEKEKARIDQLLQKQGVIISLPGEPEETFVLRKQEMDLPTPININNTTATQNNSPDPMTLDLLKLADKKVEQLTVQLSSLEKEKSELEDNLNNATRQLSSHEREITRLSRALESGSDTNKMLLEQQKIDAENNAQQANLQLHYLHKVLEEKEKEIEQLKSQKKGDHDAEISRLQTQNNTLLGELRNLSLLADELKEQVEKEKNKEEIVKTKKNKETKTKKNQNQPNVHKNNEDKNVADNENATTKSDNNRIQNVKEIEVEYGQKIRQLEQENKELSDTVSHRTATINALEVQNNALRVTRDQLLERVAKLVKETESQNSNFSLEKQNLVSELSAITSERDKLIKAISFFENQLAQIQSSIIQHNSDKEKITEHLKEAGFELEKKEEIIRRLQDDLVYYKSLIEENEQLKIQLDGLSNTEAIKVEWKMEEQRLKKQISHLENRVQSLREEIEKKDIQHKTLDVELKTLKEHLHTLTPPKEIRTSSSQTQESPNLRSSPQNSLSEETMKSERNTKTYNYALSQLQSELDTTKDELRKKEIEIADLKKVRDSLDKERDTLQNILDLREEEVVELSHVRETEESSKNRMGTQLIEAKEQADKFSSQLQDKDREIIGLTCQIDTLVREKANLEASLQQAELDVTSLADDLSTMTKENQIINGDILKLGNEREMQDKELREYCGQIVVLEEAIKTKEREYEDLITAYRTLIDENQKLVLAAQQYQHQVEMLSGQMGTLNQQLVDIGNHLNVVEEENSSYVVNLQAFERQVEGMGRSIRNLEERIKAGDLEKERMNQELMQSREYGLKMASSRETLQRELALVHQQCETLRDDLEHELQKVEVLTAKLDTQTMRAVTIEDQLRKESLKEVHIQLTKEEIEMELVRATDMIAKLQTQVSQHAQRIRELEAMKDAIEERYTRQGRQLVQSNYEKDVVTKNLREFQDKTLELEKVVDDQKSVIQAMDEERTKFKGFVMMYENKLKRSEDVALDLEMKLKVDDEKIRKLEVELRGKGFSESRLQDEILLLKKGIGSIVHPLQSSTSNRTSPSSTHKDANKTPSPITTHITLASSAPIPLNI